MTIHRKEFLERTACIDFETTSLEPEEAEIIEQGISVYQDGKWHVGCSELHNCEAPSVPPESSAVNNITKAMIKDSPVFDLMNFGLLKIEPHRNIFVSHNSKYDSKVLEKYVDPETFAALSNKWLCSYRMIKALHVNDPAYTSLSLAYMRYRANLEVNVDTEPHRAGYDSYINGLLLEYAIDTMEERGMIDPEQAYFPQLKALLAVPIQLRFFYFGKYVGREIEDVAQFDYRYLKWMFEDTDTCDENSPNYDIDLATTLAGIIGRIG